MTQYLVESQESALTPLLGGFDDDTDVIQSLDRHVPGIAKTVRGISDHDSLLLLLIFQNISGLTL